MLFYILIYTIQALFKQQLVNFEFSKIFQAPVKRSPSIGTGTRPGGWETLVYVDSQIKKYHQTFPRAAKCMINQENKVANGRRGSIDFKSSFLGRSKRVKNINVNYFKCLHMHVITYCVRWPINKNTSQYCFWVVLDRKIALLIFLDVQYKV